MITAVLLAASKFSTGNFIKIDTPSTEYKVVDRELRLRNKARIMGYLSTFMEHFTVDG